MGEESTNQPQSADEVSLMTQVLDGLRRQLDDSSRQIESNEGDQ